MSIECYMTDCKYHNQSEPFCDERKCNYAPNTAAKEILSSGFNTTLNRLRAEKIISLIDKYLADKNILELGFGDGLLIRMLAEKCKTVAGVDCGFEPFHGMLNVSGNSTMFRKNNIILVKAKVEDFSSSSNAFDYIIAAGLLEHLDDPIAVLRKYKEYLKDDGFFIATVPNAESLHRKLGVKMGLIPDVYHLSELDYKVGHQKYYDSYTLMEDFSKAGYRVRSISGFFVKPFNNAYMDTLSNDIIIGLNEMSYDLHHSTLAELVIIARLQK